MSPLEEFMRNIRLRQASGPVITSFVQCNKSGINDVDIKPGQWIICADTKDYYVDTNNGVRNKVSDIIFVDSEDSRTEILGPISDKLYVERDSGKVYIYEDNEWVLIATMASNVYTSDGHTVEEKLSGISKIGRSVDRVTATQSDQTQFTIPFPFQNYLSTGNYVEVFIDSKLVDENLYTISGTTLTLDSSIALGVGEIVRFVFWYNDYSGSVFNPDSILLPAANIHLANGMSLQQAVMILMEEVSTHISIAKNVTDLVPPPDTTEEA